MSSEWLTEAIRDCHNALQAYDLWDAALKVQFGEMLIQEFCEGLCPLSPCKDCPNRGTEECEYCYPSCEIGSGSITCPLKVSRSYSSNVCYLAQQGYEKFLKHLLKVYGIEPPKEHKLVKLLSMLPVDLRAGKLKDLIECIYLLKNYNVARYLQIFLRKPLLFAEIVLINSLPSFVKVCLKEGGYFSRSFFLLRAGS